MIQPLDLCIDKCITKLTVEWKMLEALTTVCSSLTWVENNTLASIGPTRTYRLWSVDLCSDEDEEDLYIHPMPFILIVNIYQRTSDFEQDLNWVRTSINNLL